MSDIAKREELSRSGQLLFVDFIQFGEQRDLRLGKAGNVCAADAAIACKPAQDGPWYSGNAGMFIYCQAKPLPGSGKGDFHSDVQIGKQAIECERKYAKDGQSR